MTRRDAPELEVAELERWYRLPSPSIGPTPADTSGVAAFGLCLACAVIVLIAHAPRGAY
jgi:hypothetical protein